MKKILFVCVENSCRSQMAEGFARVIGKGLVKAYSAGSRPRGAIHPQAIEVMKEKKVDISRQQSKGFADLPTQEFDHVITLGCHDTCPFFPAEHHGQWDISDPSGKSITEFRRTRDQIEANIRKLVEDLKYGKAF